MNYVCEWFIDWKWALGKIIFCTDLFSLVVWLFRFSDPLIMNELLQLVWIFTVLIESLNEWLLLYWLNYGLDWNGLERWSSMIWPLLKDADSVSDGRRRLKSIQSAFLIFCILQGGTQMWRRRKSNILGSLNDTNEHLNILRAEISTQLEGPSKSHELAWKWFRGTKLSSESYSLSCLARFGFFVRPTFLINIYILEV